MKTISCTTLNLAVQEQYQSLIKSMGGEDKVKKYPEVYSRIQKIKECNEKGQLLNDKTLLEITEPVRQLVDAVYFPAIYYDSTAKKLTIYYAASYAEKPKAIFLTLKVLDKDGLLVKEKNIDPTTPENCIYGKEEFTSITLTGNYSISLMSMVTRDSKDISLTQLGESGFDSISVSPPFAARAQVSAPKKNTDTPQQDLTGDTKYIRAFYNRYPFRETERDVDYVYEGTYDDDKKVVSVNLEGGGSIDLLKDVQVGSFEESSDIAIMDFGCGAVKYTSEGMSLGIHDKKFSWLFKPDWNAIIEARHYFAETRVNLTYKLGFFQQGNIYEDVLYMSSLLEKDMGYSCRKIRKLHIAIGCVAEGTKVLMADGSHKKIENINIGDRIIGSPEGEIGEVYNTWRGTEDKMYCIHTVNDHVLLLTGSHYVYTDRGIIKAEEMNMAIKVQMADKSMQSLKYLYTIEGSTSVYNLSVRLKDDSSGCMVCEGIVLKDNDYYEEPTSKKILSEPADEFLSQLRELMSKR